MPFRCRLSERASLTLSTPETVIQESSSLPENQWQAYHPVGVNITVKTIRWVGMDPCDNLRPTKNSILRERLGPLTFNINLEQTSNGSILEFFFPRYRLSVFFPYNKRNHIYPPRALFHRLWPVGNLYSAVEWVAWWARPRDKNAWGGSSATASASIFTSGSFCLFYVNTGQIIRSCVHASYLAIAEVANHLWS